MSDKEKYSLMIWCGALWDIAEKSKEFFTQKQIEDVREQIEKLITSDYIDSRYTWKFKK